MEKDIRSIQELQRRLLELGYYQFQVDGIIRDVVGTTDLTALTPAQAVELAETLEDHVAFAIKCLTRPKK